MAPFRDSAAAGTGHTAAMEQLAHEGGPGLRPSAESAAVGAALADEAALAVDAAGRPGAAAHPSAASGGAGGRAADAPRMPAAFGALRLLVLSRTGARWDQVKTLAYPIPYPAGTWRRSWLRRLLSAPLRLAAPPRIVLHARASRPARKLPCCMLRCFLGACLQDSWRAGAAAGSVAARAPGAAPLRQRDLQPGRARLRLRRGRRRRDARADAGARWPSLQQAHTLPSNRRSLPGPDCLKYACTAEQRVVETEGTPASCARQCWRTPHALDAVCGTSGPECGWAACAPSGVPLAQPCRGALCGAALRAPARREVPSATAHSACACVLVLVP